MRPASLPSLLCCAALIGSVSSSAQTPAPNTSLQSPSAFASIANPDERSRAIFAEAAKVLTHPRCMNCHPASDRPLQGNDKHPHEPLVTREHLAHDDLVAWGWQPGPGRDPAPGSQAVLGELIQAWIDTGAQCP